MQISLTGKNAVITGGSKGLGFASASAMVRSGASVAIVARGQEALDEAKKELTKQAATNRSSAKVFTYSCDVTSADQLIATHAKIKKDMGGVDILMNNAGEARTRHFEEIDDALWLDDFNLKMMAAVRLTRLCWPDMKTKRWGRVINTLNNYAKAPAPGSMPTCASRAAGMAFTKALSLEGAPHNILVNGLLVGVILSDQIARGIKRRTPAEADFEKGMAELGKRVPLGRIGQAEEFANIACFLASDQASYITGTAINVDGGMTPVV